MYTQQPIVTLDKLLALTTQEEVHKYLLQMTPAPPKRAPTAALGAPTTTTATTSTMVQTKST